MKENYQAWNLDIENFYKFETLDQKIRFLIKFAVLAPSSHNTQPWRFSVLNNQISIYLENARCLPIADNNNRQLFLSLGCSIENILIAANHFGYSTTVEYPNKFSDYNPVAIVSLNKYEKEKKGSTHLIYSILSRKTNRNRYLNKKISSDILQNIKSLESVSTKIHIINNKDEIHQLGSIAVISSIRSMDDKKFRYELSKHIKSNITSSKIGMPGFTLGIPTLLSFLLPQMIRRLNLEKIARRQNQLLFDEYTPYIILITTDLDTKYNWLDAGRIFQRISLILTNFNISVSPWGAPIQIENFYQDVQKVLQTNMRPQMFFRVGYPITESKFSPRIPSEELIK